MARSRNQPRGSLALLLLAILVLLAVLAARVDASPYVDANGDELDDREGADLPGEDARVIDAGSTAGRASMPGRPAFVPVPIAAPPVPVAAVVAAARRAAGLADDPSASWRRRARLAALVPWLGVRAGRDETWRDVADPTLGHTAVYDVRATWHLDRLVFDPNELRIAAIEVSRRRERRRVAELATHAYYAWLRLRADAGRDARWAALVDEATAELDAMTDGWFSQVLAAGSNPHETR